MRIDVVGRNLDITEAIEAHVEKRAEKLLRYFDGVQLIRVVIEELPHSRFEVEVIQDLVKHDDLVAKADGDDLYRCIDAAMAKSERQTHDHKEKLREH